MFATSLEGEIISETKRDKENESNVISFRETAKSEPNLNMEISIQKKDNSMSLKTKKPAGYLIIISSLIHNIMDGIAVGIAFASQKIPLIIATNIAILLHEIPKELGDAGILINSNFTPKGVLFWNVFINFVNVVGTIVGLGIGQISETSKAYSLGFVAGNFFYIALAEMIPEIMQKRGLWMQISQFFFILFGILVMFLIVYFESLMGVE